MTGIQRCVASVPDRSFTGARYTVNGYLYPVVENNSELGLLIGVSSGGDIPVPTGDILWRIDSNEVHTLLVSETPTIGADGQADENAFSRTYAQTMSVINQMVASVQNGATLVGGKRAEAILAEMRSGSELVFREAVAAPNTGLIRSGTENMGIVEEDYSVRARLGLDPVRSRRPIKLDDSFEAALQECGL